MSCSKVNIEIIDTTAVEPVVLEVVEMANTVWCDGLKPTYPTATTPLSDDDKVIVRQGNEWKEVDKSDVKTGYNDLKPELKETIAVTTNIDWRKGVAFQVPELTADTTFTFSNVQENKQIKIYLKGDYAFSFPANVDVSNVNYDGTVWNVIALEAMNINGSQTIKSYSI